MGLSQLRGSSAYRTKNKLIIQGRLSNMYDSISISQPLLPCYFTLLRRDNWMCDCDKQKLDEISTNIVVFEIVQKYLSLSVSNLSF